MKTRLFLTLLLSLIAGSMLAWTTGSIQITTEPSGAVITLQGTNVYLGTAPTTAFELETWDNTVWMYGKMGHVFDLQIQKPGYHTQTQQIFIPLTHFSIDGPLRFHFQLTPLPPNYYHHGYYPGYGSHYGQHQGQNYGQHANPKPPTPNKPNKASVKTPNLKATGRRK